MSVKYIDIPKSSKFFINLADDRDDYVFNLNSGREVLIVLYGKIDKQIQKNLTFNLLLQNTSVMILGIFSLVRNGQLKLQTSQYHASPITTSNLLVKSVLRDNSSFYFDGNIKIAPDADKVDAYQRNENLLVSKLCVCETKPTLEIEANDVRCTHGATCGPLPEEQLWYLSSRGISRDQAEKLIISGFLNSTLQKIEDDIIKNNLIQKIWEIL